VENEAIGYRWRGEISDVELVRIATDHAKQAGCEWLHVEYEAHLEGFYLDACGFRPTRAGVIHLFADRPRWTGEPRQ
jgi:hypothetical protein